MQTIITGPVTVIGKNIDTDQIYPGRYLALTDPKEIGSHCLSGLDENIAPNFQKGGLIVAETNFGCGSSREHAPIALLNMGASAVIADSFARIFFRNAINNGLLLIENADLADYVKEGEEITVTVNEKIECRGKEFPIVSLPDNLVEIINAGGLVKAMRKRNGLD